MKYQEKKILNFKPEQLFNLVSDINKYPDFLPWCLGSRVKKISNEQLNADLIVGVRFYREVFKSKVFLNKKDFLINVDYLEGPFNFLKNKWIFKKVKGGCEIDFYVEFQLNSYLLNSVLKSLFEEAIIKMVSAFEERANFLYK
tara:strand:+ start:171 stop:599 length:429 start_codon:yes stop_codon:yes gene_type:complete